MNMVKISCGFQRFRCIFKDRPSIISWLDVPFTFPHSIYHVVRVLCWFPCFPSNFSYGLSIFFKSMKLWLWVGWMRCNVSTAKFKHYVSSLQKSTVYIHTSRYRILFGTRSNSRFYSGESKQVTGPTFTEVLGDLITAFSVFPLPFFGRLGVLRCLDDVPCGVLLVRSAAAPREGSEGTARQLGTVLAI